MGTYNWMHKAQLGWDEVIPRTKSAANKPPIYQSADIVADTVLTIQQHALKTVSMTGRDIGLLFSIQTSQRSIEMAICILVAHGGLVLYPTPPGVRYSAWRYARWGRTGTPGLTWEAARDAAVRTVDSKIEAKALALKAKAEAAKAKNTRNRPPAADKKAKAAERKEKAAERSAKARLAAVEAAAAEAAAAAAAKSKVDAREARVANARAAEERAAARYVAARVARAALKIELRGAG